MIVIVSLFLVLATWSAEAAQNKWSAIGPYGGYAYHFTFVPGTRIVFAAVDETYGIPLRSTDSGVSWSTMTVPSDFSMKIRASGKTVFCISQSFISRSNDAGLTWNYLSKSIYGDEFDFEMHSQNPEILYYAASNFPKGAFYKSTNGGKTWNQKIAGITGTPPIGPIEVSRQNGNNVYMLARKGIYRSTDAGESWKYFQKKEWVQGTPDIRIDPNNSNTLYEFAYWSLGDGAQELYKTTDGGKSWQRLYSPAYGLSVDPRNSAHLLISNQDILQESFDGGVTVNSMPGVSDKPGFLSFVEFDPSNPSNILLSQFLTGILRSTNAGKTWMVSNRGVQGITTFDFLANPNGFLLAPVSIYLSYQLFRGNANGTIWRRVPDAEGMSFITMHPKYPNILAGRQSSRLSISSDGGITWSYRNPADRGPVALSFDPVDPNTLYMAPDDWNDGYTIHSRGITKTTDQGRTWTTVWMPDSYRSIRFLANHPKNRAVVLAADQKGQIIKTTDSGRSWVITRGLQCSAEISSIAFSSPAPDLVYASTYRSSCSHLYKSTDAGSTWESLDNPPTNDIGFYSIVPDEKNPQIVYALNRVLYVSNTGGKDWSVAENKGLNFLIAFHKDPTLTTRSIASGSSSLYAYTRFPESGPIISQIFPNPANAGADVELRGRNFGAAQGQVLLGTQNLTVQEWTDQSIVVKLGTSAQTAPLRVISSAPSHSPELIVLSPSENVHPLAGPSSGGTRVAIHIKKGSPGGDFVLFGDKYASNITPFSLALRTDSLAGDGVVVCTTPPGSGRVAVYLLNYDAVRTQVGFFDYK